jgi:uncharacterized protein (DUF1330 family)
MPAYWVARSRIVDAAEYKKYTDRIPAIFAKYGGRVLARGGRFQIMEGPEKFHRFVVVEFDSFERGVACFQSPEWRGRGGDGGGGRRRCHARLRNRCSLRRVCGISSGFVFASQ